MHLKYKRNLQTATVMPIATAMSVAKAMSAVSGIVVVLVRAAGAEQGP